MVEAEAKQAREMLALSGSLIPLALSNVAYKTRDSLLLYNLVRAASLLVQPNFAVRPTQTLLSTLTCFGLSGQLLHEISSYPLVIDETRAGEWSVRTPTETVSVFSYLRSNAHLSLGRSRILAYAADGGDAGMSWVLLGLLSSLWRSQEGDAFPWSEATRNLHGTIDQARHRSRRPSLKPRQSKRSNEEITSALYQRATDKARQKCCVGLMCAGLFSLSAVGPACHAAVLLGNPNLQLFETPQEDLEFLGYCLLILDALGLGNRFFTSLKEVEGIQESRGEPGGDFKKVMNEMYKGASEGISRDGRLDVDKLLESAEHFIQESFRRRNVEHTSSAAVSARKVISRLKSAATSIAPDARIGDPNQDVVRSYAEQYLSALDYKVFSELPELAGFAFVTGSTLLVA
jgi:hypothetical protein